MSGPRPVVARRRRNTELGLGVLALLVTAGGYALVALAEFTDLPPDLPAFGAAILGLYVVAHLALRRLAPGADGTLLPIAVALNGIGFVAIARLDRDLARIQSVWSMVGVAAFVVTLVVVRDIRILARYRYVIALVAIALLLLPLAPGVGATINGARLWVRFGSMTFQPGEAAKVLFVVFFAAYLVDHRDVLASGSTRIGRMHLPALRHLGPLLLAWGVSLTVMIFERDLGSSLLFLSVFVAMVYMATNRAAYVVVGLGLFAGGAALAYRSFDHVARRVDAWLDPWSVAQTSGYQLVQSWYAFGTGGISGTGLGLGVPDKIPAAATDFVFAAIGEELGLVGTLGIVMAFLLLVGTGFRIAADAERGFSKLLAAGLTTILGVQTFIILGGVTRLIPLTGITLPFVSYGGSSLVANFVILALLARISHDSAVAREAAAQRVPQAPPAVTVAS